MKKLTPLFLTALLSPGILAAQEVAPISSSKNLPVVIEAAPGTVIETRPGVVVVETAPVVSVETAPVVSVETQAILLDRMEARDRAADVVAAMQLKDEIEAQRLVDSILARANAAAIIAESKEKTRARLAEANRTESARSESITYLSRRLRGEVTATEALASFRSRLVVADPVTGVPVARMAQPHFYNNDQRVVTYRSINEVPPVLIASARMNRVTVQPIAGSPYAKTLVPVGYGDNEAAYPSDSREELLALDRRVAVYRLKPAVTVAP